MAAKKKPKLKKVSLMEFRAWLEGVEEMQDDGWVPNPEQWKTIREKMDSVTPDVVEKEVVKVVNNSVAPHPNNTVQPMYPTPRPAGPSVLEQLPPSAPKPQLKDGRVVTPNIDTTDGDYKSGFV